MSRRKRRRRRWNKENSSIEGQKNEKNL